MGKRDEYAIQIKPLILKSAFGELEDMLIADSNLPGPRGNLELAYAFAGSLKSIHKIDDTLWHVLTEWVRISAEYTPADSPKEFIPFCAVQALGAVYFLVDSEKQSTIIKIFKGAAKDSRWRVREAAAIGLQWIEEQNFRESEIIFDEWIDEACLLEKRAIIAALAHPPVLKEKRNVLFCLAITEKILNDIIDLEKEIRRSGDFRVLRQGLEYAVSVFVAELPEEGFEFMKKWAQKDDSDIRKVIKSNLGKSRLTKKFGQQVNEVLAVLTGT